MSFLCARLCWSFCILVNFAHLRFQMRGVSWNVNGLSVVRFKSFFLALFLSSALICLQETFETDPGTQGFTHASFVKHATPATPTGGRPSGGLLTFFSLAHFGNADLQQLPVGNSWLLISRAFFPESGLGLLVVNVYIPR